MSSIPAAAVSVNAAEKPEEGTVKFETFAPVMVPFPGGEPIDAGYYAYIEVEFGKDGKFAKVIDKGSREHLDSSQYGSMNQKYFENVNQSILLNTFVGMGKNDVDKVDPKDCSFIIDETTGATATVDAYKKQ